jgi:hypothetical protein
MSQFMSKNRLHPFAMHPAQKANFKNKGACVIISANSSENPITTFVGGTFEEFQKAGMADQLNVNVGWKFKQPIENPRQIKFRLLHNPQHVLGSENGPGSIALAHRSFISQQKGIGVNREVTHETILWNFFAFQTDRPGHFLGSINHSIILIAERVFADETIPANFPRGFLRQSPDCLAKATKDGTKQNEN